MVSVAAIRRVLSATRQAAPGVAGRRSLLLVGHTRRTGRPGPAGDTDAEGRFTVHGVGRGLQVVLTVRRPAVRPPERSIVETDSCPGAKSVTMALVAGQDHRRPRTYADTGKPVPHARSSSRPASRDSKGPGSHASSETDAEGRFRVNPIAGRRYSRLGASPRRAALSDPVRIGFEWPKGAVEQSLDLALPRGVLIRGKVTEEGSGPPVAGCHASSSSRVDGRREVRRGWQAIDGRPRPMARSRSPSRPRTGHLLVCGPSDDYVLQEIGVGEFSTASPAGRATTPTPSSPATRSRRPAPEVTVALRPGVDGQRARSIGPDGQPVPDAWILSRTSLDAVQPRPGDWRGDYHRQCRDGRFELHGLDPDTEVPVYFLEPKHKLGAIGRALRQAAAGEDRRPSGSSPAARPRRGSSSPTASRSPAIATVLISMVVTPGPRRQPRSRQRTAELAADDDFLVNDRLASTTGTTRHPMPRAGSTFPALIPGATYRIIDLTTATSETGPQLRKDFTVKPGETLDLGDILIEKPEQ